MSRGLNKVQLIGRLGDDPECRYNATGTAITTIRVATGGKYRKQDGSEGDDTEWHRVVFFNKLAEIVNEYLRKGSQVYIEGRVTYRSWEDDEGNKKYMTEIVANDMQMLGDKRDGEQPKSQPTQNPPARPTTQQKPAQRPTAPSRNVPQRLDDSSDLPF